MAVEPAVFPLRCRGSSSNLLPGIGGSFDRSSPWIIANRGESRWWQSSLSLSLFLLEEGYFQRSIGDAIFRRSRRRVGTTRLRHDWKRVTNRASIDRRHAASYERRCQVIDFAIGERNLTLRWRQSIQDARDYSRKTRAHTESDWGGQTLRGKSREILPDDLLLVSLYARYLGTNRHRVSTRVLQAE